jgi:hypothetical protein
VFGTLHTVRARQHSYGAPKCEAGSVVRRCYDCGVAEQEVRSSAAEEGGVRWMWTTSSKCRRWRPNGSRRGKMGRRRIYVVEH